MRVAATIIIATLLLLGFTFPERAIHWDGLITMILLSLIVNQLDTIIKNNRRNEP